MPACELSVVLDRDDGRYRLGEPIGGQVEVRVAADSRVRALDLLLRWDVVKDAHVLFKGEELRRRLFAGDWPAGRCQRFSFRIESPSGPCSYRGGLFDVQWRAIASAELAWDRAVVAEAELSIAPGPTLSYYAGPSQQLTRARPTLQPAGPYLRWTWPIVSLLLGLSLIALLEVGPVVVGCMLLGLAAWLVVRAARAEIVRHALGDPAVDIRPEVLAPGQTAAIEIVLRPRSRVVLQSMGLVLVQREHAERGANERTESASATVLSHEQSIAVAGEQLAPGVQRCFATTLQVPATADPSFGAPGNQVQWLLEVGIAATGLPRWQAELPLIVIPGRGSAPVDQPA